MSANEVHLKLRINFPVIFIAVLSLHLLTLAFNTLPELKKIAEYEPPTPLKIRQIKNTQKNKGIIKTDLYMPEKTSAVSDNKPAGSKSPLSFKDLSITKAKDSVEPQKKIVARPGTRPETPKAINAISLKGQEFKEMAQGTPSGSIAVNRSNFGGAGINDAVVSMEVPEGVEIDELNKYELMFYSFQRRTALNYANSIMKNLNKFSRENPHYKFDQNSNIVMTARLTYDEFGNVTQIKMIRWTHIDKVQNFFEDVVKGIDQLHNPPKALWEKSGEFSMFFTLEING